MAPSDGRLLYRTGKIWINRGDRIVLLGPNGSGKTLLISMMPRAITTGNEVAIKAVPTIVLGHADQSLSHLDNDLTPFAAITKRFDVGDQRARSLLAGAQESYRPAINANAGTLRWTEGLALLC